MSLEQYQPVGGETIVIGESYEAVYPSVPPSWTLVGDEKCTRVKPYNSKAKSNHLIANGYVYSVPEHYWCMACRGLGKCKLCDR